MRWARKWCQCRAQTVRFKGALGAGSVHLLYQTPTLERPGVSLNDPGYGMPPDMPAWSYKYLVNFKTIQACMRVLLMERRIYVNFNLNLQGAGNENMARYKMYVKPRKTTALRAVVARRLLAANSKKLHCLG